MGQTKKPSMNMDDWIKKLNELRIPVVARTTQEISKVISDQDSSATALSRIIMRDASMSARVLRIANSSFHRTGGPQICTVSRAVVKLGFGTIRSITRSVSVVEALLKGEKRDRVLKEMAHAFHAAAQARSLAELDDPKCGEDVFVATLLYRIGKVGFWCLPGEMTKPLEAALKDNPDSDMAIIEKDILGFSLQDLTARLSEEWDLGPILCKALEDGKNLDPISTNISLGHQLADAIEDGWDSVALAGLKCHIAEKLDMAPEKVREMLEQNAEIAADNAEAYGFPNVASLISMPESSPRLQESTVTDKPDTQKVPRTEFFEPNPTLQLECLRELAIAAEERPSIGELLDMILEGIHRGIGMDRTLFALLTPDKKLLKTKHALGDEEEQLTDGFVFIADSVNGSENLFSRQLKIRQPLMIPPNPPEQLLPLLPEELLDITGRNGFYSAPIVINKRSIGLFYTDRFPSGRELDQESFKSFKHFTQQANISLAQISQPGK